ncbi:MAG: hypothetical protein ACJAZO_004632 [Myxococcota bacterium]
MIHDQAAEIVDPLGNLALEAAKSDRLALEELKQAESDAKNRARASAEVAAAASMKRQA